MSDSRNDPVIKHSFVSIIRLWCKLSLTIISQPSFGKILEIKIVPIRGKAPLNTKETKKFETLVEHFKEEIVEKWIDFFVMNKEIKPVTIYKKLN